jgi:hypothetical protein
MAQPPKVEKHGEFGVTAQFVIEVQPLLIRNSFQQFFCLRALRDRIVQLALDDSSRTSGHVRDGSRLCENVHAQRTRRIVFSLFFFRR